MNLDRRALLRRGAALAALGATSCASLPGARRAAPLALADITVRRELALDYAGTLRRVAALGYRTFGFRLAPYDPRETAEPTAAAKAAMVRDAGMAVEVVRLGVRGGDYRPQLDQAAAIGATIVALSTAPVFITAAGLGVTTRPAFDAWLPELARLGEAAQERGLTLAYHNHWYDLAPLGGEAPLDLMARQIAPATLSFEVDLAWAWFGGVDPLALLERLGPRVVSMHWKDIDRTRGKTATDHAVAPGSGEMDYTKLIPKVRRASAATGYVEVDNPDDGMAAAAAAIRFIRGIG